jgi:hypothetical protein
MLLDEIEYSIFELLKYTTLAFIPLNLALCVGAIAFDIGAKYALLGTRKQGS